MNGPRLYASISGWALGWGLTAAIMFLGGRSGFVVPWFALASAGFGLGAGLAARGREQSEAASRARPEGIAWGVACFAILVIWLVTVVHAPSEAASTRTQGSFNPLLVRTFELFVLFGLVGGLLSTTIRLGDRVWILPGRCVAGALAWGLAHTLVAYPLFISVYFLIYGMAMLFGMPGAYIGAAMGGAFGGILVGTIGESLTNVLLRPSSSPASL